MLWVILSYPALKELGDVFNAFSQGGMSQVLLEQPTGEAGVDVLGFRDK